MKPCRNNKTCRGWMPAALALLFFCACANAAIIRVTSWDLQPSSSAGTNGFSAEYQSNLVSEAAETLKKLDPDVILLQQVMDWETCNRLAKALKPAKYVVGICSSLRDESLGKLGKGQVAILSKNKPYLSWADAWDRNPQTPSAPGGFAFAAIRVDKKNIGFFSVQLGDGSAFDLEADSSPAQQRSREESVRQLLQQIKSVRNWSTNRLRSQVVAGEFDTSVDDSRFVGEKTLLRLEQFGLKSALGNLPPDKRVTLPGNEKRADATTDYIFVRDVPLATNSQIFQAALTEHGAVTTELDLDAPKKIPAPTIASAPPPKIAETNQTNHAAIASFMAKLSEPAGAKSRELDLRILAGAGAAVIGLMAFWLGVRFKVNRAKAQAIAARTQTTARISGPVQSERLLAIPPSQEPPFVRIEVEGATQSQSQLWEQETRSSPSSAGPLSGPVRAGIIAQLSQWLKSKFVQKLVSDRAKLLETHQAAALKVMAMDERLSKVERQIQERNREYEQRIDALLKELEEAREENRELIRAKIALLKAEMEKNSKLARSTSNLLND